MSRPINRLHELRRLRFTDRNPSGVVRITVTVEEEVGGRLFLYFKVIGMSSRNELLCSVEKKTALASADAAIYDTLARNQLLCCIHSFPLTGVLAGLFKDSNESARLLEMG